MNNIMSKLLKNYILCFLVSVLFACEKDGDNPANISSYFGIAGGELEQIFSGESEIRYVTVSTNQEFTVTSSDPSWCTVETVDDKVDNIKIKVSENSMSEDRVADIIVSSPGFDHITIKVRQNWLATIIVDQPYILLSNDQSQFTLKITGNIDYEMELPDWIIPKEVHGDGTYLFEYTAISPGERLGNIVITSINEVSPTKVVVPIVQRERVKKIGSWLFDDPSNLSKATIGEDIQMVRNTSYNPNAQFLFVEGPNSSNKAVRIPVNCHFLVDHGMIPKEGESFISEYTLFFEFKIPIIGRFYSFFQTNLTNTGDAEIFVRNSNPPTIGVGATGYAGGGLIQAEEWHRLYLSFKPGDVKFFLDGVQFHSSTTSDSRFRIDVNGVILCGGPWAKKDDNEFDIAEISIWNGALTLEDVRRLENIE